VAEQQTISLNLVYMVNMFSAHIVKVLVKEDIIPEVCNLIDTACLTRDSKFSSYIIIHHSRFTSVPNLG